MGKKKNKAKSAKYNKKRAHQHHHHDQTSAASLAGSSLISSSSNFLPDAGRGCHIARKPADNDSNNDRDDGWILEWEDVNPHDFVGDDVPDLAVDPDEHTLTLCNVDSVWKVAYITVFGCVLRGRNGKVLTVGSTTSIPETTNSKKSDKDPSTSSSPCTTLIVLCPPHQFAHLCYLPEDVSPSTLKVESDVQEWQQHPGPADTHALSIRFPLGNSSNGTNEYPTPFTCTQGVGGHLTHFFRGNQHAVDFRCPVGTPLLAVGPGKVVSVKVDCNGITGIAATNLFAWNSILIELDTEVMQQQARTSESGSAILTLQDLYDPQRERLSGGPLFVEYVHIESAVVAVGDVVEAGQVIGNSGSVGFSPEPHLHLACYRTDQDTAPTCRVYFQRELHGDDNIRGSRFYIPQAGKEYNRYGPLIPEESHRNCRCAACTNEASASREVSGAG